MTFDKKRGNVLPDEEFAPIEGFPEYLVSNQGQILNRRTLRVLRVSTSQAGWPLVCLTKAGKQYTRILSRIVATTFLPIAVEPNTSVLHRDRDRMNNIATNLAWKPRWFVVEYMRQMNTHKTWSPIYFRATGTGEIFETIGDFCESHLYLPSRIWMALANPDHVFPVFGTFEYSEKSLHLK